MKTVVTKWNSRNNSIQQLLYDGQRSTPTSPDILVLVMMTAITLLLRCKILMDSFDLRYPQPYPLPGIFPATLPEVKKPYSSVSGYIVRPIVMGWMNLLTQGF